MVCKICGINKVDNADQICPLVKYHTNNNS